MRDVMKAWAVHYMERFGFSVLPVGEDKKPSVKWAEYQDRKPTFEEVVEWPIHNLGVVTGAISNLVIVDCDTEDDAKWFAANISKSPAMVKSRRGYHFYFRHPGERIPNGTKIMGHFDVRGDGGYALLPPSSHSEGDYYWVEERKLLDVGTLPLFAPAWRQAGGGDEKRILHSEKEIRDAVKYISRIKAVSGSRGHDDTYRAACVLCQSGLSEGEALLALQEWNETNAEPKWSNRELLHKIRSAFACQDRGFE